LQQFPQNVWDKGFAVAASGRDCVQCAGAGAALPGHGGAPRRRPQQEILLYAHIKKSLLKTRISFKKLFSQTRNGIRTRPDTKGAWSTRRSRTRSHSRTKSTETWTSFLQGCKFLFLFFILLKVSGLQELHLRQSRRRGGRGAADGGVAA